MSLWGIITGAESSGRSSVINPVATSSGNAAGLFQITPGTWADFAPRAGISLSDYPATSASIASAPADVQSAVAGVIPLNRWASSTVAAVQSAYGGGLDTSQTLGQLASSLGESGFGSASSLSPFTSGDSSSTGASSGSGSTSFSWTKPSTWGASLQPYAERGVLVLLALVLLIGGVWLFANRTQIVEKAA